MTKIYNEIVIDMNPESSTFEETLFEDSFEYEGDMMLMAGWEDSGYRSVDENGDVWTSRVYINRFRQVGKQEIMKNGVAVYTDEHNTDRVGSKTSFDTYISDYAVSGLSESRVRPGGEGDEGVKLEKDVKGSEVGWGAQNITKEMFVDAQGNPKTIQEIYTTLDPILTGVTGADLVNYINDLLPQFTGVPEEEKDFLAKERGFTEEAAGLDLETAERGLEADIYGLQPKPGGAITPTTGGGMRGSIGAKADIKKGFGAAYDVFGGAKDAYSLTMDKAKATETKGLYGLEKDVTGAFETDIVTAIGGIETPFADPGGTALTDPDYFSSNMREGGRVPSRSETFLDFLTQLPDAGGM
jgi:hypothetical protein